MSQLGRGSALGRAGGSSQRQVKVPPATGGQHGAFPEAPGYAERLHGVPMVYFWYHWDFWINLIIVIHINIACIIIIIFIIIIVVIIIVKPRAQEKIIMLFHKTNRIKLFLTEQGSCRANVVGLCCTPAPLRN